MRRIFDNEGHAQFVTFSCYRRRRLLDDDRCKRIVIGTMGAELANRAGVCIGFVIMPDHVHMCIAIPPKYSVASVIGFLKGKSAIAVARLRGKERNFTGEHFWARGYAVSTVGFELEQVKAYIRDQDAADEQGRF